MEVNLFPAIATFMYFGLQRFCSVTLTRGIPPYNHTVFLNCFSWTSGMLFFSLAFLSISEYSHFWDPDPCDQAPSFHWPPQHQTGGSGLLPSKTHHSRERTFQMATRTCRKNTWCWTNTEGDSTYFSRNFFWSECQQVGFLVSTYFDLDFRIQVDPIKQPIKSDTVSSRHMSQSGTSSFNYNLDHGFVVFTDVQLRFPSRRTRVGGYANALRSIDNLLVFYWHVLVVVLESSSWVEHTQLSLS